METDRLNRWRASAVFLPNKNDLLFVEKNGLYNMQDRIALLLKWRREAETQALNAILIMMTGGLK